MTRQRFRFAGITALALLLSLTACSASSGSDTGDAGMSDMSHSRVSEEAAVADGALDMDTVTVDPVESHVIQEAWLNLGVDDVEQAVTNIGDLVAGLEGRIDHRSMYRGSQEEVTSASLQVRVPSDSLTEAIAQLGDVGTIRDESTNARDVTMQHVDLTARVDSLTTSITRLEALLEETTSVSELIEVETALADRQADLESLTAQLDSLTDAVQYATLGVEVQLNTSPVPSGETSFMDALVAGFWSIISALNGLMIMTGYALPWLGLAGVIMLVILAIVKVRKTRKSPR